MNYDEVVTFLTVANEKNITDASKTLFVSQSTVSQRIKNIENEFNIKLFEREKGIRNINITKQGEEFLILANQYIYIFDRIKSIQVTNHFDHLTIGGIDIVNSHIFYSFYKDLVENKNIRLNIFTHHSNQLFNLMETKKLDMAFTYSRYPSKEIISKPLFSEPMYLVTSKRKEDEEKARSYLEFERSKNIYLKWSPQFDLWFSNHWNIKVNPYINVNTGNLLFKYLEDVDGSWTIAPLSVIKSWGIDKVIIIDLDIKIPNKYCFQLVSKNISSYKRETYQKFQRYLLDYLSNVEGIYLFTKNF
ncbi:LysR family transcriptional regulator [Anaerococcus sp. ENR1011]|uniref:LysR family transcriptional regulator n=1 Tax=Anaerococcus groningensis TaxID=3115616 RepID=A0ABW9MZN1_9FIRM